MLSLTVKVAWPEPLVVPETVVIVEEPLPLASVTVFPETGFEFASLRVTVTVDVVEPSATIDVGEAVTVDCAAVTGPAVKVTVAVCVTVTESVVSVAVYAVASATVSLTVKVAWPEPLVTPETVVIVEEPLPFASVTVLPEIGCDCASLSVTVTVDVATPFAVTDAGAALTVDCAAVTALR